MMSITTFNIFLVPYYPRSLLSLSNTAVASYAKSTRDLDSDENTSSSTNMNITRLPERSTQSASTKHHDNPTVAAHTPTAVRYRSKRFFVSLVYYLLRKRGGFNAAPVECVQENVQMLSNRHRMERRQRLNSLTPFGGAKRATRSRQSLFGWGYRPRV